MGSPDIRRDRAAILRDIRDEAEADERGRMRARMKWVVTQALLGAASVVICFLLVFLGLLIRSYR